MALVSFAEGQQRSGRLGSSVYSHNAFGQYIRTGSIPVNPNTDRQVDVRNAVRFLTIGWGTILTQAQRDAWEAYAADITWVNKLGNAVYLTALNHYIRSNVQRLAVELARVDDAPILMYIAAAEEALSCIASEATQQVSVTFDDTADWCSEDGAFQFVYVGLPQNASRKFFGGPFRHAAALAGNSVAPITSPQQVGSPFPFGAGQRLWIQSRISRADGRLSERAQHNFLCIA